MVTITRIFEFEAAHSLSAHKEKCQRLHGHSYQLQVTVTGPMKRGPRSDRGMIMDFSDLKKLVQREIISKVDHVYLNESLVLYPTAENLVGWIASVLSKALESYSSDLILVKVRLYETSDSYAEWSKR